MFNVPAVSAFFRDLDRDTFWGILNPATATMELVIVSGAEVQPEAMLRDEKLPQGYVGQREILRDHGHLGMLLRPASEVLLGLLPKLISPHALTVQLVRNSLDGHLDFLDLGIIEGLVVSLEGCCRILEEKQDALHWQYGDVQIHIPESVALVGCDFPVA